ncbi:MtrB/PioB family decaheme-associated outer membrane protein [Shewanella gaetbuli]|uniref:MtrB/PioB family decaheme-associated outer membrane protein n=1 Tax=Shewanella gaetbuli TaxID=220752 RepID=A0A9X1ZMX6_9GAMM|nr:MtrB/PioB family decaheme-associated outer membrane protein [Shewanella gaetbuli]MCL1142845.1 MtrB/PioB family decaheme-associated outer membrane protein [Shewanella gaetbuli]
MSFKRNMITLAMAVAATPAMAANFGVNQANTESVNTERYECKRCTNTTGYTGEVSVSAGYNDVSDVHAGNALGTGKDGGIGAVSGDVKYQGDSGYQAQIQAHQLGMDNGFARLSGGKAGLYQFNLDYDAIKTYQAGDVESPLWHNNGMLTPSDTLNVFDLGLRREKVGLGFDYGQDFYGAFVNYSQEAKTGTKSSSLVSPSPINFGQPIDATTKQFDAGIHFSGQNWLTELSYFGSVYENHIDHLSLPYANDVYSATPDNQAHQVSLSGQYNINRTFMNGRIVTGRMIQDDNLIQMTGNPLQSWDGQVDTLDARYALTSMLTNRLRLGGSVDYSKRDNQSSSAEFAQYNFNSLTGAFRQNVPQDIERNTYKVNASYRIASGYRLQAGYDRKEVERTYSDREQTHDDSLWMKFNVRAFDNFNFNIKAQHANRSGSEYEANDLTSSEDNSLMRKYYLADRTRNAVELRMNHTPTNWLSLDVTTRYAKDEYDDTQIGLTESEDYGYDINLNMAFNQHIDGYVFAGQQWINSNQVGSQGFARPDWAADIEDEFVNLGLGASYSGLMQDKLTLGVDYLFSNSVSDTYVITDGTSPYGDYFSYNHSASLYADYAMNEQMALKITYRYERYFDTDAANVGVNDIPGMITLGDINHNYNAHQVMLSFTYKLR